MKISEYQQWLKEYDEARDFDRASPGHTFIHLVEELGEVARLVLYKEGYREPAEMANLQEVLAEELADAAKRFNWILSDKYNGYFTGHTLEYDLYGGSYQRS